MRRRYISFLVSCIFVSPVFTLTQNYTIADDLSHIFFQPTELIKQQSILLWTLPTLLLYFNDRATTSWYESNIKKWADQNQFVWINDKSIFFTIETLFQINTIMKNDKLTRFTYCAGEAMTDALFIAQGLKHIVGRSRPNLTNDGPYSWGHSGFDIYGPYTSFPSSHATIYFACSTILGKSLENEWLGDGIGAFAYFSLTGHNHWVSDMWMGYILGKCIGNYVWDKQKNSAFDQQWFIYPTLTIRDDLYIPAIGAWIIF